ncbi:TetR/AcrR family transcriptional regulator [Geofilum rubicundum]|nr:TetR/AcrR family transcriptional regulator [Geofilum rubicundum]
MNVRSNKKHRVFETTLKLIAEHGLHNTPMSLVSKRSGISTGAIYHHFESKEVLINELYLFVKQEIMNNIFDDVTAELNYKESFHKIWSNYFHYLIKNQDILSFVEQCSISPIIKEQTRMEAQKLAIPLIDFITEGTQKNFLINNEIELILAIINGNVITVAKLHISKLLPINKEIENKAIQTSWKGLSQ